MNISVNDYVSRKSYNNDTIFKVIGIDNDKVYLKGVFVRLHADASFSDLVKEENIEDNFIVDISSDKEREDYFYLPGKILHIDGDIYLNNNALNPYKIRKNEKINNDKNNIKKKKIGNFS